MLGYRSKLESDLPRWQAAGWVTGDGAKAIRAELAASGSKFGISGVLAILAAVLLLFGVMLFVAANWQDMPRIFRLGLILAFLWGAYAFAGVLFQRGLDAFGHAATLFGSGVYGAGIMLVAQMYHIDGNPPDLALWWGLGVALAAVLLRSNPCFVLAILLFTLWTWWQSVQSGQLHWPFLPVWLGLCVALRFTTRWRPGVHLLALSLLAFILTLGWVLPNGYGSITMSAIGLVLVAIFIAAGPEIDRFVRISRPGLCYGFALAFAGLFVMQFLEGFFTIFGTPPNGAVAANGMSLLMLGAIALALTFGVIFWGARTENRALMWLGYIGFSAEIIGIYFRTIGKLLDTSLFFLSTGVLVALLAWLAYWLHQRRADTKAVVS